jgi:hypothetical protein
MLYNQNIRFCTGDDKTISIAISNPDTATVSGAIAKYVLATAPLGRVLVSKTSPAGINVITGVPPVALVLEVGLVNNDTADLPPGDYYHEAMLELAIGSLVTVMSGTVRLDPASIASQL